MHTRARIRTRTPPPPPSRTGWLGVMPCLHFVFSVKQLAQCNPRSTWLDAHDAVVDARVVSDAPLGRYDVRTVISNATDGLRTFRDLQDRLPGRWPASDRWTVVVHCGTTGTLAVREGRVTLGASAPQQDNATDCGVFATSFMESYFIGKEDVHLRHMAQVRFFVLSSQHTHTHTKQVTPNRRVSVIVPRYRPG